MTASLRDLAVVSRRAAVRGGGGVRLPQPHAACRSLREAGAPAGPEEPLSTGRVTDGYPSVSPDGRRVAYVSDTLGHSEIWILDLATRPPRAPVACRARTSRRSARSGCPTAGDFSWACFVPSRGQAIGSNWIVAVDGSSAEEILSRVTREGFSSTLGPSPDGKKILYAESGPGSAAGLPLRRLLASVGPAHGFAREQVRHGLVARRPLDRRDGPPGRRHSALPDARLGRPDAAADDRIRAHAPSVLLARRAGGSTSSRATATSTAYPPKGVASSRSRGFRTRDSSWKSRRSRRTAGISTTAAATAARRSGC